jgi:2-polyprenyl-3-methyl-5-hydroxy-6-metoxy-1,4-benzoquinol methylase
MKQALTPLIKFAIKQAKKSRFVQNIFEAPFEIDKYQKIGEFKDSFGNKSPLYKELRSKIKPGWENMLNPKKVEINAEYLNNQYKLGTMAVSTMEPIIKSLGKSIEGSKILEIGCHSGATSYALAEKGAKSVTGSEFTGYKVESIETSNEVFENKLIEVNEDLKTIRKGLFPLFKNSDKVEFVDDDICNSKLEKNSYDMIASWEVLEHLHDTEKAFKATYDLLNDNGFSIHLYNPFFCLNGGHSLCTLDFLWGHTRLSTEDFTRYVSELRPLEKERAVSFFTKGLNRMTLHDLKLQYEKAGFKSISILPFTKEQHVRMVDKDILDQTQKLYPNLTFIDLVVPKVIVIGFKS